MDLTDALDALIVETRLLFRALRAASDRVHGGTQSAAQRSILFELVDDGERTVPQLAGARFVSRQAVQGLVDALTAAGLVERRENPAHRRSPRYAATGEGRARAERMRAREREVLGALDLALSAEEVAAASSSLREVRAALARGDEPSEVSGGSRTRSGPAAAAARRGS